MIGARIIANLYRLSRAAKVAIILALTVAVSSAYAETKIQSLNFVNAELPVVLQALATATGTNIVISPSVKGPISLRLSDMTVDEALSVITGMTDYSYRSVNGTYVVNTAKALDDQYGVQNQQTAILTLQKISPADVEAALGVMYKDVQVKTVDGRVLLVGSISRIKAAKSFIDQLDYTAASISGTNASEIYQVVRLDNVTATDAEAALGVVFKDITVKSMKDGRVVLMGAPSRLKAAVSFLNVLNSPSANGINPQPETQLVVTLHNMSTADAETAISLSARDVRAKGFSNGTVLLLGTTERLQAAKSLLELIDASSAAVNLPQPDDTVTYRLQALSKDDAVAALGTVFKDIKTVYLPVDRLVLAGTAPRLAEAVKFLKFIDTEKVQGPEPITNMLVTLKYMRPTEVAKALELPYKDVKSAPVGDTGNQIVLMGTAENLKSAKNFLDLIDRNPEVEGNLTYTLQQLTIAEATAAITNTYKDLKVLGMGTNRIYVVGAKDSLDSLKTLLAKIDTAPSVNVDASANTVLTLTNISPAAAIEALKVAYKDVVASEVNGHLMLVGPARSIAEAKGLIATIDLPTTGAGNTTTATIVESRYHIKSLIPAQVKQYLENSYQNAGLKVSYLPNPNWAGMPGGTSTNWTSSDILLNGPKNVIDSALASLNTMDVDIPMARVVTKVDSISASQAINYLLGQYEAKGLTIVTIPPSIFSPAAGNISIGMPVVRKADGTLSIVEPIGKFELQGPKETVEMALATLNTLDNGPRKVIRQVILRFVKVDSTKTMLLDLYGKDGLTVSVGPDTMGTTPTPTNSGTTGAALGGATAGASDNVILQLSGPDDIVKLAEAKIIETDTEPSQIQITATIISVDEGEVKNLGITWGGVNGGVVTPGGVTVNTGETQSGNPLVLGRIIRDPLAFSTSLAALTSTNKARIESRPSTTVQSGKETVFQAGGKIYYQTVTNQTNNGPVFTTQTIDTGVVMKVRPQTTNDGIITLDITTSVTDNPTFRRDNGVDLPVITTSNCSTTVKVRDGEMLVIGGMIQTTNSVVRTSIPILSQIPLLGELFKSTKKSPQRKELLIVVQPNIIKYAQAKANATGQTISIPAALAPAH